MHPRIIALIYFYVVSAAALMLLVIGIFDSVNLTVNLVAYDKYPLPYAQDCNSSGVIPLSTASKVTSSPVAQVPEPATPSAQQIQEQVNACLTSQTQERKQQEVGDIKNAITFTLVGLILFLIHFPIARRMTTEKPS